MAIKFRLKNYFYHVVIGIDQLFNAFLGGAADETLSSRAYRGAVLADKPKKRWRLLFKVINGLFFDKNHCETAYKSELNRKQYPDSFKKS
ncbi:DNA helicase UvrD [Pasteurellaceae bacterium 22721_9_1]